MEGITVRKVASELGI